jgi:hypothetical protein
MTTLRSLFAAAMLLMLSLPAAAQALQVVDSKLGKGVQNREIVDETTTFSVNEKAYLWLRVTGGPADDVTVTWSIGDHSDAVPLKIGGSPWRTWSSKTLWKAGEWTATVTDSGGAVLTEVTFTVQ